MSVRVQKGTKLKLQITMHNAIVTRDTNEIK